MPLDLFYDWMRASYDREQLADIYEYSCLQGVPGMTYLNETTAVYNEYEEQLWGYLVDCAKAHGLDALELLSNRFRDTTQTGSAMRNAVVWVAAEWVAKMILDRNEALDSVDEPPMESKVNSKLGKLAAALERQVAERMSV